MIIKNTQADGSLITPFYCLDGNHIFEADIADNAVIPIPVFLQNKELFIVVTTV